MRGAVVVMFVVARVAHADVPRELAAEPVELLAGQVTVRAPMGSLVDDATSIHLDWSDVRLAIIARDLGIVRSPALRDRIARELRGDGIAIASIVALALARPAVGYGAIVRAPRERDGRRLVYAAFATNRAGRVTELAFYVTSSDEVPAWASFAARVATTMIVADAHPRPTSIAATACHHVESPVPPGYPVASDVVGVVRGTLYGEPVPWSIWEDAGGSHAEAVTLVAHLVCTAATRAELERVRAAVR